MFITKCNVYKYLLIIVSLSIFFVAFLPALSFADSDTFFKGQELAIGTKFINLGSFGSGQIKPNILLGIAYILPIVSCNLTVVLKKGSVISVILFIVSAILFILVPVTTVTTATILGNIIEIDPNWTMAYGLYLGIALSVFGSFLSLLHMMSCSKVK